MAQNVGRYCDRRTRRYWCVQAEAQQEKPKRKLFPSVPLGGATNCQVKLTYHNQCVAIASPQASQTGAFFASAAEVGDAKEDAMAGCGKKGGVQCKVMYSACSDPVFEQF
ncbi:DUF4189 domain-containing protein [Stenotrophomonas africana]|uniref:DUF4189 domain-containing protein n=1 Tax=Stenotrophomonas africana TaxID=1292134 RepID=UPI0030FECC8E